MKITLFYQHATVLDYAYLDDHLGAVGNSLIVDVEFIGKTDHEGVLYDFSYAKKKVKEIIDRDCDHRLVVPKGVTSQLESGLIRLSYNYGLNDTALEYEAPDQAFCIIPYPHVSIDNMKTYLEGQIIKEMPENVIAVNLSLRTEELASERPVFHYTHGLKDHYGNCQRLFHGHRNTLDVWVDGEPRFDLAQKIIRNDLKGNIHFCYWKNVINQEEIIQNSGQKLPEGTFKEIPWVEIGYESSQGKFHGKVPGHEVYFIQSETTVENLSIHFAQKIKRELAGNHVVAVKAYEGIGKGALTTL